MEKMCLWKCLYDGNVFGNVYGKHEGSALKVNTCTQLLHEKLNHIGGKSIIKFIKCTVVPAHDTITMENVQWIDNNILTDLCQEQETINFKERTMTDTKPHNATFSNNGHSVKHNKTLKHYLKYNNYTLLNKVICYVTNF